MNTRKILSGGRVTIPAGLRKKYGIKAGTKIFFKEEKDGIILYPVTAKTIKDGIGFLKHDKGMLKSLMEEKKREREREL